MMGELVKYKTILCHKYITLYNYKLQLLICYTKFLLSYVYLYNLYFFYLLCYYLLFKRHKISRRYDHFFLKVSINNWYVRGNRKFKKRHDDLFYAYIRCMLDFKLITSNFRTYKKKLRKLRSKKRASKNLTIFFNFNNFLIISSIEHLLDSRVLICFKCISTTYINQHIGLLISLARSLFFLRHFEFNVYQILTIFFLGFQTKDVDFLLTNLKILIEKHHFSKVSKIFPFIDNAVAYL